MSIDLGGNRGKKSTPVKRVEHSQKYVDTSKGGGKSVKKAPYYVRGKIFQPSRGKKGRLLTKDIGKGEKNRKNWGKEAKSQLGGDDVEINWNEEKTKEKELG